MKTQTFWGLAVAAMLVAGTHPAQTAGAEYKSVKTIQIGGDGGWDYLSVDADARRLYVTHASRVVVVDLDTMAVVGEIDGLAGVHGFAIAPDLHRGYASNGQTSSVTIVDLPTLKAVGTVQTGENPDAILYDPRSHEVYAFNGRGKSATVFSASSAAVVATIPLLGKPEFAVVDPGARRVYVNIEDRNEIVAIDDQTHAVAATWSIAPGEAASGLAIDRDHHHLFAVCENQLMVMVDSMSGKVLATAPIGAGTDAAAYDPQAGLAFSSNGEGNVTILREDGPDKLTVVQTLQTERSARTMTLDPKTHHIFLSAAKLEPPVPQPAGSPPLRPRPVPDTFHVLVYGSDR